jgi:hypothetical protein
VFVYVLFYFVVVLKLASFIFGSCFSALHGSIRQRPTTNRDGKSLFLICLAQNNSAVVEGLLITPLKNCFLKLVVGVTFHVNHDLF